MKKITGYIGIIKGKADWFNFIDQAVYLEVFKYKKNALDCYEEVRKVIIEVKQ